MKARRKKRKSWAARKDAARAALRTGLLTNIYTQAQELAGMAAACRTLGLYELAARLGEVANGIQLNAKELAK